MTTSGAVLPAGLLERCAFPAAGAPLVCGISGGADSLALLALSVRAGCSVTAVHVEHGLQPSVADRVEAAAGELSVPFECVSAAVAPGAGLEARARAARLTALAEVAAAMGAPGAVATGHTLDDRAETLILNLGRGCGPRGLADPLRPSPRHPLTRLRRAETSAVCSAMGWRPVDDPANGDPAHTRNRVRREVLPLLDDVMARDVAPLLVRFADLLGADVDHLARLAAELDPTDARALAAAPGPLAARAVAQWLAAPYSPPRDAVDRVLAVARGESRACEVVGGVRVVRSDQRLSIVLTGDPLADGWEAPASVSEPCRTRQG